MHSSDSAVAGIDQQNRDAVCDSNADTLAGFVGDERIAFALAIFDAGCIDNAVGVDLPQRDACFRIRQTRAEAVFLSDELLEGIATIDAIQSEAEGFTQIRTPG